MNFHIIFTPGTVKYFRIFTLSLLRHSDVQFTLIANGCNDQEFEMLIAFSDSSDRLNCLRMPGNKMRPHHKVLNWLFPLHIVEEPFCFMDSDILATGDFLSDLLIERESTDALYSAMPLWSDDIIWTGTPNMPGRNIFSPEGTCLGSSYFAIYDSSLLKATQERWQVDFSRYKWHDIPERAQEALEKLKLKAETYDTAKVLNILFQYDGHRVAYRESPHQIHIGALSRLISQGRVQLPNNNPKSRRQEKASSKKEHVQSCPKELIASKYVTGILFSVFDGMDSPARPDSESALVLLRLDELRTEILSLKTGFGDAPAR